MCVSGFSLKKVRYGRLELTLYFIQIFLGILCLFGYFGIFQYILTVCPVSSIKCLWSEQIGQSKNPGNLKHTHTFFALAFYTQFSGIEEGHFIYSGNLYQYCICKKSSLSYFQSLMP